jgi:glycerol-3-phosphate dehydrogenase (NAD(P)+)
MGVAMQKNVVATNNLQEIAENCRVIFPILPSAGFRETIRELGKYLRPHHILIHGTKGFDLREIDVFSDKKLDLTRSDVCTMSEVIREETSVLRIGCLSGPNLASEIMAGQPTMSLVASRFSEVIEVGKHVLNSNKFHVFGSNDILGAELAGALKNIVAIGSGILAGMNMGRNIQSILISRGLAEMIYFGKAMGASSEAFLGTAGIGDLVATATSTSSRNFSFGMRIAQGEKWQEIEKNMPELAEGVRTLRIARQLARTYKLHVPITMTLYAVVFEGFEMEKALDYLMTYPFDVDVDFV